jgi:hypothetical protein
MNKSRLVSASLALLLAIAPTIAGAARPFNQPVHLDAVGTVDYVNKDSNLVVVGDVTYVVNPATSVTMLSGAVVKLSDVPKGTRLGYMITPMKKKGDREGIARAWEVPKDFELKNE